MEHKGERYNEGKLRYDLLHPVAQEGIVKVLTKGANKYAPRNWENGLSWTSVIASMKRHIAAIEKGEDYDPETGELHINHVQCNAHFLSAFYKIYPQGDDRVKPNLSSVKIGLDIDGVLADFVGGFYKWFNEPLVERPIFWNSPFIRERFSEISTIAEFWMSLDRIIEPDELPFEPHCYITSRSIDNKITESWLKLNGFPVATVYTVGAGESKVQIAKQSGIDIFVDDYYKNFQELNGAGVSTFLMNAPYNERYDVGFKRINHLKELI